MPDPIYGPPQPEPDPRPQDRLFGDPIIRGLTMEEQLARWFSGYKYEEDPSLLSMLTAMLPNLPVSGAVTLPNMLPQQARNLRTARAWMNQQAPGALINFEDKVNPVERRLMDVLNWMKIGSGTQGGRRIVLPEDLVPSQQQLRGRSLEYQIPRAQGARVGDASLTTLPHRAETYPRIFQVGDELVIDDGHHRAAASLLRGKPLMTDATNMEDIIANHLAKYGEDSTYQQLMALLKQRSGGQ